MLDFGFYNMDCMEGMKEFPDKYFDLAIVDPPYGIDMGRTLTGKGYVQRPSKDWDKSIPSAGYFKELFRVSKNQVIWGGNYFIEFLRPKMCWLVWNKMQRGFSLADGELAWTSFDKAMRIFDFSRGEHLVGRSGFHPTEKPVALYKWILTNYAKPGDKILDTHVGSASSLIACYDLGFDYVGFEIDEEYYKKASERLEEEKAQIRMELNI